MAWVTVEQPGWSQLGPPGAVVHPENHDLQVSLVTGMIVEQPAWSQLVPLGAVVHTEQDLADDLVDQELSGWS